MCRLQIFEHAVRACCAPQNLDFDFEKCCSVSLSPLNVYACLVCGKYFQGRGPKTHAYTHALEVGHQMFMKLKDGKVGPSIFTFGMRRASRALPSRC